MSSCEPCKKAFSASDNHIDHRLVELPNSPLAPAVATASSTNSDTLDGVGLSRLSCRRSGSEHPMMTTRVFGFSGGTPRFLSR